jgi:hypothetical protein
MLRYNIGLAVVFISCIIDILESKAMAATRTKRPKPK